jgi:hypothetical protein
MHHFDRKMLQINRHLLLTFDAEISVRHMAIGKQI